MSLMEPTLAEKIDRLTILERKIVETELVGGDTRHLLQEVYSIQATFSNTVYVLDFFFALRLSTLNAAIWDKIANGQAGRAQELNKRRADMLGRGKI